MSLLSNIPSEQINIFIFFSNLVFIILIIYVGIKTFCEYKEISILVDHFVRFIYEGFNKKRPDVITDTDFCNRYWVGLKGKKSYEYGNGIRSELDKCPLEEQKLLKFQSILNANFSPVALKLKKANSYFEGLASLGLFGTVFGLLVSALNSDINVLMHSFSTALITTFLGLLCQLIIRFTRVDVIAENGVEDFQGKIIQLAELVKENRDKLSDDFLDGFTVKSESNTNNPDNKEAQQ